MQKYGVAFIKMAIGAALLFTSTKPTVMPSNADPIHEAPTIVIKVISGVVGVFLIVATALDM